MWYYCYSRTAFLGQISSAALYKSKDDLNFFVPRIKQSFSNIIPGEMLGVFMISVYSNNIFC